MILTIDPELTAMGLPAYPPLSANTDASKIEVRSHSKRRMEWIEYAHPHSPRNIRHLF